jgi:poly(3-hydroxybutyrate) depolymerase
MKNFFLFLLLFVAGIQGLKAENITVGGQSRNYIVYVPNNLGEGRPLLISCHGMNQDAAYQKGMLQIESIADTAKFVTVFPNGIDKSWDIGGDRDINFVLALIDKMVEVYKIDRNRVYLSGFSMGGMFTYHAMNRIADKIAAFAPISGYPMGGTTANANVRPIPIIHTHGTSDDVVNFSGVQGALNAWINHNGCPTRDVVERNYRGASHITRHTWGPGNNNVEVVLMELAGKGHWISNDIIKTGDEIWRFCKRYSLEMKDPMVKITSPTDGLTYITMGGTSEVPDLTIKATASDPDGEVTSVSFYKDNDLLATFDQPPYTYTLSGLTKGEHALRAVVTDDEGRTGSGKVMVYVLEPTTNYLMHNTFTSEGSVPEGWATFDGNEHRTGFSAGYSSGSRVFHFTGSRHDFEWGLYTRNVTGATRAGYARWADKSTTTTLTLYPGQYQMMCRVDNWNQPNFSPVTVAVENINGQEMWSETFTPTANIGNAASNDFSGSTLKIFKFDVTEKGRYTVTFYTADAPWADLVVGQAAMRRSGNVSAVGTVDASQQPLQIYYYNMAGQRIDRVGNGPCIERKVMANGNEVRRVIMK